MSKSSYEKCYASYPGRSNEIDTAREVLRRHGTFCADAVREFAQQADMSINESRSILRCLWRDAELKRFQEENEQLWEDLEFERSENEWMREFNDRMAKHCGTKDCPSLVAYVTKLENENRKLRELENIRISQVKHCEDLDAENAKLRELVRDMWNWLAPIAMGSSRVFLKKLSNRMRKLGIWEDYNELW